MRFRTPKNLKEAFEELKTELDAEKAYSHALHRNLANLRELFHEHFCSMRCHKLCTQARVIINLTLCE